MTIGEVLRRENLGKKYKWDGKTWLVVEDFYDYLNLLDLKDSGNLIDTDYFIETIANADFEEIIQLEVEVENDYRRGIKKRKPWQEI